MKFNMPFYACDSWMKSDLILDVHCAHNAKKVGSVYCAQSNQVDAIVQLLHIVLNNISQHHIIRLLNF